MVSKLLGVLLVIISCGGAGCAVAAAQKREIQGLEELIHALELMRCELEYRVTPLPQLCKITGTRCAGVVGRWFCGLGQMLEQQEVSQISACTSELMSMLPVGSSHMKGVLGQLCQSLGRFDLSGQLNGIDGTLTRCRTELDHLTTGVEQRTRSVRTLGFCAGSALAILLL